MEERLINASHPSAPRLLLAHGAGAGMDAPFLEYYAQGMTKKGITVIRFCFPYMHRIRQTKKRRPPDVWPKLQQCFREEIANISGAVVIAGKSMGGRVASTIMEEDNVKGGICLGYPFHPPKNRQNK